MKKFLDTQRGRAIVLIPCFIGILVSFVAKSWWLYGLFAVTLISFSIYMLFFQNQD